MLSGAITGGLASAAFYGAGKAVQALRGSIRSNKGGSGETVYIPSDSDGNPIPLNKQKVNGHDVPWGEVHWTDHGTPYHHTNPHQHIFEYNPDKGGWIRKGRTIL